MVDKGESGGYSIGHLRIKYLDLANMSFAQGNYSAAHGYIDDFLDSVDDSSVAGKIIKEEFDSINIRKKSQIDELHKVSDSLRYLEQKDTVDPQRESIEINALHDMKEVCWRVGLKEGLFYD